MPEPRIIPPAEAREWREWSTPFERDLAHTAAVLGEQREAVLALHRAGYKNLWCEQDGSSYPCPTARALGVSL